MIVGLTGATGQVGHWIAAHLLASGHDVVALGRRPSHHARAGHRDFDLEGPAPDLSGIDMLVHAAFAHVPGRYRGGEGDDPEAFLRRNLQGSIRLFGAARAQGVARVLFLSSRAVYGAYPPGTMLHEGLPPRPDTLYGRMKHDAEQALAALAGPGMAVASLRATGVYGPPVPGLRHKWQDLLDGFDRGEAAPPRAGTEVHADDLAQAVRLLAEGDAAALGPGLFNVSDFILDRHDLLTEWSALSGKAGTIPERADPARVSAMTCGPISALGWRPRGPDGLRGVLQGLAGLAD